jgi:hypothetical protein
LAPCRDPAPGGEVAKLLFACYHVNCGLIADPFMIAPFPLYVDEISPDKIKATVSDRNTVYNNLRTMALDMPFPIGFSKINGIFIVPAGKFICMLVKKNGNADMIILDLMGKKELAEKMAEKLRHVDLRDRFMDAYAEIISHPENHGKFGLVVGKAEDLSGDRPALWYEN